jgi:membrane protein implicated in regulation of membrane protease activity
VLYAYVSAAIIGVVLLAASLVGAGHGHSAGHDVGGPHASPALALLSLRVWTYLLAFGGATGVLLRLVAHAGEPASAIAASFVGIVAAAMARVVIGRAARAGASGTVRPADLVGRSGHVLVPFAADATGKVRVRIAGGDLDLLAVADGHEALDRNDEVLILEVRPGGAALVTRNPASSEPK